MRVAVIDLGTNTFNLLIAEVTGSQSFSFLHSSKITVKIAKGSYDRKELKNDAILRGLNALEKQLQLAAEYNVEKIHAFATAAIRNARNSNVFLKAVLDKFNLEVTVIEGEQEAEFVCMGVRQTGMPDSKSLIVDIGGGSIEFIVADKEVIHSKRSYQMGVSYLIEKFRPSDPLLIEEMEYLNNFFEEKLIDLITECREGHVDTLIGASGAFESILAMILETDKFESEVGLKPQATPIDLNEFDDLFWRLVNSTTKERKKMKGLEHMRLEFIVPAALLIKFLTEKLKIRQLYVSNFALKEGILYTVG